MNVLTMMIRRLNSMRSQYKGGYALLIFVWGLLLVIACKEDDPKPDDSDKKEKKELSITNIAPLKLSTGDTLTVTGTGFGTDRTQLLIFFTGASNSYSEKAGAITLSDTVFTVKVPDEAVSGSIKITLVKENVISEQQLIIKNLTPAATLKTVLPVSAPPGSELTIKGAFPSSFDKYKAFFGTNETKVKAQTSQGLTVVVPELDPGSYALKLINEDDLESNTLDFEVTAPPTNVRTIYFTTYDGIQKGEIVDVGSGVSLTDVYAPKVLSNPDQIGLDPLFKTLYFTLTNGQSFAKGDVNGGKVDTLYYFFDPVRFAGSCTTYEIDHDNDRVYFLLNDYDESFNSINTIASAKLLSKTPLDTLFTLTKGVAPRQIQFDAKNKRLYYSQTDFASPDNNGIFYLDLTEDTPTSKSLYKSDTLKIQYFSIDLDGNKIFAIRDAGEFGKITEIISASLSGEASSLKKATLARNSEDEGEDVRYQLMQADPDNELLYVVEVNYDKKLTRLVRCNYDGSNREEIFSVNTVTADIKSFDLVIDEL